MENEILDLEERYFIPAIEKMRWLMMFCAILYTYGIFSGLQDLNGVIFGFAFPALYIMSGYVVLRESPNTEKRILRTIGRTALCFVILFAVYLGFSLIVSRAATLKLIASKTFWTDFLLLNICSLPIGSTIWFVQALLYAYIIIYILYKLRLLKLDIFFAILCLAFTLYSGELSFITGFRFLGHTYLGGNFLTRALPYILIGSFIARKRESIDDKLYLKKHIAIFIIGALLTIAEYVVLTFTGTKVYVGHLLGMGVVAVSFCLFCFFVEGMAIKSELLKFLSRFELMIPFFLCSPIYYVLLRLLSLDNELYYYIAAFAGLITMVLSLAAIYIYSLIRSAIIAVKPPKTIQPDKTDI